MKVRKVINALWQADRLVCGELANFRGGRCALGQLFFAAGKTNAEIRAEEKTYSYDGMFDGLLAKEYGLNSKEVAAVVKANDGSIQEIKKNEDRVGFMVKWVQDQWRKTWGYARK